MIEVISVVLCPWRANKKEGIGHFYSATRYYNSTRRSGSDSLREREPDSTNIAEMLLSICRWSYIDK